MVDPTPAHVGDVEEAVDPAQVDERAEVRDVLDDAAPDLADLDVVQEVTLLGLALFLEELPPGDDDVHPGLIDLDDLALEVLPDELGDVAAPPDADLRCGKEDGDPDFEEEAALDLPADLAADDVPLVVGRDHALPAADPVRLPLREGDHAALVLDGLEEHLDLVPLLDPGRIVELIDRDHALGLVADVDDDVRVHDVDDPPAEDAIHLEVLHRLVVELADAFGLHRAEGIPDLPVELFVAQVELLDEGIRCHVLIRSPNEMR